VICTVVFRVVVTDCGFATGGVLVDVGDVMLIVTVAGDEVAFPSLTVNEKTSVPIWFVGGV
jgi:hypothetical protein